jgi:glucose uptake protein
MVLIQNYFVAITFTVFAMICWGSWANTQKMLSKTWRFELFYWDLIIGILIMSLVSAFTVGSIGISGRHFLEDLKMAGWDSILFAMLGGLLWNIGNLLLVAAISIAGMSVAFPIGGGLAWVLGIILNYINIVLKGGIPSSRPFLLWTGIIIIIFAILLSGKAYNNLAREKKKASLKGILLSVIAGLFIAFFYPVVVNSLDPAFVSGGKGNLTPYTAVFFFAIGVFISTFFINPFFMRNPVDGPPVRISEYFKGTISTHLTGILGGAIWMLGMIFSYMAVGAANPAIAYALSNAAPVVAILWGVLIWKEFKGAPKGTENLLFIMFIAYVFGLVLITLSNA